jgi:hypothetical protein
VCVANDLLNDVMEGGPDLITSIDAKYRFAAMNQACRSTGDTLRIDRQRAGIRIA